MRTFLTALVLAITAAADSTLPGGPPWPELQATPTMGYNGWLAATMGHEPDAKNQTIYYRIADKLIESGLAVAGYDTLLTVCIGWIRDPATGKLEAPKATWPDGFKALVDYAHAKVPPLKVGAYTDTGPVGCCKPHEIGSYGHEELDVQQFADWGVDHLSVDNCGHPDGNSQSVLEYAKIYDALVKVGKPMVYGIWNIGAGKPQTWANKLGHYWRTGSDVGNRWGQSDGVSGHAGVAYNFDVQQAIPSIAAISGPGSFAFLDQLMIGQVPDVPHPGDTGLTEAEALSHFGLWCMMASPLWLTYDIFHAPPGVHEIVTNIDALKINQDTLGQPAVRIDGASRSPGGLGPRLPGTTGLQAMYPNGEQFARPLANGDWGVLLLNRLPTNLTLTLVFTDIGDTTVTCFTVRDVWAQKDLGPFTQRFQAVDVPPHGNRFLRLTPGNESHCAASTPMCPTGYTANIKAGYWANTDPCRNCTQDRGQTVNECAEKCNDSGNCVAFELFDPNGLGGCYIFHTTLEPPFVGNVHSMTCLKNK